MNLGLVRLGLAVFVGVLLAPCNHGLTLVRNLSIVFLIHQSMNECMTALKHALSTVEEITVTDTVGHVVEFEAHLHKIKHIRIPS